MSELSPTSSPPIQDGPPLETGRSFRIATDIAWLLLLLGTAALWFVFESSQEEGGSTVLPLMGIMTAKSLIIGAVFMDLWRSSKLLLVLLGGAMAFCGLAIALLAS